jgi:hypothetical protein
MICFSSAVILLAVFGQLLELPGRMARVTFNSANRPSGGALL